MGLTVLEIGFALGPPVGPDAVGGAEQVLALVDAALTANGHRSIVIAAEGSCVEGELVRMNATEGPYHRDAWIRAHEAHAEAIRSVLAAQDVDVVHLHGIDFWRFLPDDRPAVVALHLPPAWYRPHAFDTPGRDVSFVCVSESQARAVPAGVRVAAVIPNGVPLDVYRPGGSKDGFALVLSRICPEKGIAPALAAARSADVPLLVAGSVFPFPDHLRYLEEQVRPLLDGARRLLGPVGRREKARLLAAARCVVIPSLAPETSSLVAMEALACGTPVVARRVGALPEIIEDGRTGLLVDTDEALAEAIRDAGRLSPADCRRAAEARFCAGKAGRRWVQFLERVGRPARPRASVRVDVIVGLGALDACRAEWSALCDGAPTATPFQRPEWLLPYCRAFGVGEPFAVALRRSGRLVALAPLVSYEQGGTELLTLLGAGISDYQDAVLEPGLAPEAATRLLEAALAHAERTDALLLEHLPDASLLRAAAPFVDRGDAEPDGACPVLALPGDPSALDRAVARRILENVRYGRRRLARRGARCTAATAADLDRHLSALFALHGARWNARGETGVVADPRLRAFHAEAARGLLARGLLRLHVLWVDGRPAAAFHGFLDHGRLYYYLGGFDPTLRAASPGAVVIAHAIDAAIAEGATEVDFLRGREPYKYAWGAQDRATWRRVLPVRARRSPNAPAVLSV
ncbi:MAG TPA: GNAT family N-acetyltransferase [Anaeromyxobacter sp.]